MPDDVNVIPTFSFQLTPSRRATTLADVKNQIDGISTHALTEGDFLRFSSFSAHRISTHALTEGDSPHRLPGYNRSSSHFNSRPHGGRRMPRIDTMESIAISTHALTEGDILCQSCCRGLYAFQLTPSRRATINTMVGIFNGEISTHALTEGDNQNTRWMMYLPISTHALTEGDAEQSHIPGCGGYFNSRPHGGRRPDRTIEVIA